MDLCGTFAVPSSNKLGLKYGFLLSMLTLSTIGLLGDFLVVDTLGETKRWTLWNIWWADDAGKVLAKFGIDDMVNSLLITRTATILSLILSVVALILLTYKTLYSPRVAMLVPIFACTITVAVSSFVAVILWASVFSGKKQQEDPNIERFISIRYGYGFFTEIALSMFSMLTTFYLCLIIHAREQEYHRLLDTIEDNYEPLSVY